MEEAIQLLLQAQARRDEVMQEAQAKRDLVMTQLLTRLLAMPAGEAAGPAGTNVVATIQQQTKCLADQMTCFEYDAAANLTFEAWYSRYESIFETTIANWTEPDKMSLLLQKFSQADYRTFADAILPTGPTAITLAEAVKRLKSMFGYRETKFSMRHKCFHLKREQGEEFINYASRINKHGEKFDVAQCSGDDLKVLLFISGLKDKEDSQVLDKLLTKVDALHQKREAAADDAARALIPKLTLNDLVNEAQRLINMKQDRSEVIQSLATEGSADVFAIENKYSKRSGKSPLAATSPSKSATRPCSFCSGLHYDRDCDFKDKRCDQCKNFGHKAGHCNKALEVAKRLVDRLQRGLQTNQVKTDSSSVPSQRKFITPAINGAKIKLQLDSASDVTIISKDSWTKLGKPTLRTVNVQPGSASGHLIKIWGEFDCKMTLHGKSATGSCLVSARLNLLGLDWIGKLGLWEVPWSSICNQVTTAPVNGSFASEAEQKFPDLFSPGLGRCTVTKASLILRPGARPIFRKARTVPFAASSLIEEEIARQLHLGVFEAVSFSEYAAPIVAVKKKNGKIRICGDYSTGLNDSLEANQYPLPTADQIFTGLSGNKIFSVIDLSDAFLQLELDDDAKKLLVVNTHAGLFQVNRMQPGVKTAPGMFQQLMTTMLSGLGGSVYAFIDDIVVGAANMKDHRELLFKVLQRIHDYGFKLRIEKCSFGKESIRFCGHIVSKDGVRPDSLKIQAIQDIPAPKDVPQLRSFLGAANYYGKFVKNINAIRGPLDELTQKDVKFQWTPVHQKSFEGIKEILASNLILTHFDPAKPIVVAADACQYGKGGAIMHRFPDGSLHPVMHVSSSFTAAEKNYPQVQREALALVFTVKSFHKYLFGRRFELQTDHKPLLAIFGSKTGIPAYTASRLQRYALILLAYDFSVSYINTESFGYVDVVSRLIAKHPPAPAEDIVIASIQVENEPQCFAIDAAQSLPVKFADLQDATRSCPILKQVAKLVEKGWPRRKQQITDPDVAAFYELRDGIIILEGCLFYADRIVVPKACRNQVLQELHTGHPGFGRMKMLARSKVIWPTMNSEIERKVKSCTICAESVKAPIKCTLKSWPIAEKPWSRIHADYAGPVNGVYYLVIVDSYSNWPEIFKTAKTTTTKTIEFFLEAFARTGLPDTLVTDNGAQFTSAEFNKFTSDNGIVHLKSAPYHPQSNGKAEKFVDLLKTGLAKAAGTADQKLQKFLTSYRFTPSYALGGKSPSELMNGRPMKTRLDLLRPPPKKPTLRNADMEATFNAAHGAKWKSFSVGDFVYYKLHKSNLEWSWSPGVIIATIGQVCYELKLDNGRLISKAHANQLKVRHVQNEISDVFGLHDLPEDEVEPTITPNIIPNVQEETALDSEIDDSEDDSDSHHSSILSSAEDEPFEDAQSVEDDPVVPAPQPEMRRTNRANAGIPAQRYGH